MRRTSVQQTAPESRPALRIVYRRSADFTYRSVFLPRDCIVADSSQASCDAELWHLSLVLNLLHMAWVRAVAGRLKTDIRYSSALCYNTFPLPKLTEQNRSDLGRCAKDIVLVREAHFPATIADLYDPENMPGDLRAALERNVGGVGIIQA